MTKHTPGPWLVEPSPDRTHFDVRSDGVHLPLYGVGGKANAALIAAAPDLLAALEGMVGAYGGDRRMSAEGCIDAYEKAQATIAKAGGAE